MARIHKKSKKEKNFARLRHHECLAVVEFSKSDIQAGEENSPAFVVCPYCKNKIAETVLYWRWE